MAKHSLANFNRAKAEATRDKIRQLLIDRPGILNKEIASIVGMSAERVGGHIKIIRAEWRERA